MASAVTPISSMSAAGSSWAISRQAAPSASWLIASQPRRRPASGGSKRSSSGAQMNLKV